MDKLFENGAQDVFLVPIIMKKSRPAVQLKILCSSDVQQIIENIILKETTSLGLRYHQVTKSMLDRKIRTIETLYGPIRVKEAFYDNNSVKYKAEYDDCVKAAIQKGVSLSEVYEEVSRCMKR
jgi:pyridinium-3,5-bisthiocarboxylic acid mononucleotide nickel chelatase